LYQIRRAADPRMFDEAWSTIPRLLQGLSIIASGFASARFRVAMEAELYESTADEETRQTLREMAAYPRRSGISNGAV